MSGRRLRMESKFKELDQAQLKKYQGGKWVLHEVAICREGLTLAIMYQDSGFMRWITGKEYEESRD